LQQYWNYCERKSVGTFWSSYGIAGANETEYPTIMLNIAVCLQSEWIFISGFNCFVLRALQQLVQFDVRWSWKWTALLWISKSTAYIVALVINQVGSFYRVWNLIELQFCSNSCNVIAIVH
jgi:hypothetical protein